MTSSPIKGRRRLSAIMTTVTNNFGRRTRIGVFAYPNTHTLSWRTFFWPQPLAANVGQSNFPPENQPDEYQVAFDCRSRK